MVNNIQDDSGGKISILVVIVSDIVRRKIHVNLCLILNGYRDTAVCIFRLCYNLVCGVRERTKFTKERWIHKTNFSVEF